MLTIKPGFNQSSMSDQCWVLLGGPRTHLGPNLRSILCQVLGPNGTNQDQAGRNRALKDESEPRGMERPPCGTNQGPSDESGPLRMNQVMRDGSGPVSRVWNGLNFGPWFVMQERYARRCNLIQSSPNPRATDPNPVQSSWWPRSWIQSSPIRTQQYVSSKYLVKYTCKNKRRPV